MNISLKDKVFAILLALVYKMLSLPLQFAPPPEKLKKTQKNKKPSLAPLDSEALLLEDLSSGHTDVCDTMASRTKVSGGNNINKNMRQFGVAHEI